MEVYRAKYFQAFFVILGGGSTLMCFLGLLIFIRDQNWTMSVLGFVTALWMGAASFNWFRSLINPEPIAVFTATGITNEGGSFLPWSDVVKSYTWAGVLFVKDASKSNWFLRIEPLEVGGKQFKRIVLLIHERAPVEATIKLKLP